MNLVLENSYDFMLAAHALGVITGGARADKKESASGRGCVRAIDTGRGINPVDSEKSGERIQVSRGQRIIGCEIGFLADIGVGSCRPDVDLFRVSALPIIVGGVAARAGRNVPGGGVRFREIILR